VDAAHFVYGAFLCVLWCAQRLFVKTPAGRQRLNVLAALNAVTKEVVSVTNDTYVTAETVCTLLYRLAALHVGVPITLVLDNARYQRCALVQEVAARLNIELLFLPAYSPNLNLIKRFWKFVKKRCLYGKYYADSAAFQQAILDCIAHTPTQHKAALETLLTLQFQTFQDVPIVGEQPQDTTLIARPKHVQTHQKVFSMAA
jgi:transposase